MDSWNQRPFVDAGDVVVVVVVVVVIVRPLDVPALMVVVVVVVATTVVRVNRRCYSCSCPLITSAGTTLVLDTQ